MQLFIDLVQVITIAILAYNTSLMNQELGYVHYVIGMIMDEILPEEEEDTPVKT